MANSSMNLVVCLGMTFMMVVIQGAMANPAVPCPPPPSKHNHHHHHHHHHHAKPYPPSSPSSPTTPTTPTTPVSPPTIPEASPPPKSIPPSNPTFPPPTTLPPPTCPIDIVKLGVCVPLLSGILGSPKDSDCCALLDLIGLNVEVCWCTAIDANILGIIHLKTKVDVIASIFTTCGRNVPPNLSCP